MKNFQDVINNPNPSFDWEGWQAEQDDKEIAIQYVLAGRI